MNRQRNAATCICGKAARLTGFRGQFAAWQCECSIPHSTPLISEDAAGTAIAVHAGNLFGTETDYSDDKLRAFDQKVIDRQVTSVHECKHHLPTNLCTICPANYGVGRVA